MFIARISFVLFIGIFQLLFSSNPYEIDFPKKKNLTNEDYLYIQEQIRNIDIDPLLREKYAETLPGATHFGDFEDRCTRAIRQILIDPSRDLYPITKLEKIGEGGDNCIVCCVPCNRIYADLVRSTIDALKAVGFNGYYYYRIGGYPNPTGEEIRYAAVPYGFKLFMMLEAYNLGFKNVLWLDSAAMPLRDISPFFKVIEKRGIFWFGWEAFSGSWQFIFPSTRKLLFDLTKTDVLKANYVCMLAFGLKMDSPETADLVKSYYQFVEMGTPFLSCFPEEFVFTALLGQEKFASFRPLSMKSLLWREHADNPDTEEAIERARNEGYYFFHKKH